MARLGTLDNIRVRFALHYAKKRRLARIRNSNQTPSPTKSITVNSFSTEKTVFDSGFVFGRNSASVPISGTATPGEVIQARAYSTDDGGVTSSSWVDVATSDVNGDWNGAINVSRSSSWYRIETRIGSELVTKSNGSIFGVGHVIAIWGQSEPERLLSSFEDAATPPIIDDDQAVQIIYGAAAIPTRHHVTNAAPYTSAVAAMADTLIATRPGEKFAVVFQTVSGTDPRELVNDSNAGRSWASDKALHDFATADGQHVGLAAMSWFSAPGTLGASYGEAMFPLFAAKTIAGVDVTFPATINYGSGLSYHADHWFGELYDYAYTKWVPYGPHRFDIDADLQDATHYVGGSLQSALNNKQLARQSWRSMQLLPDATMFLPQGVEPLTYLNGKDDGAGGWTDYAHPAGNSADGRQALARLTAAAILQSAGLVSWDNPVFDNCYWEPTGAYVEVWSSAGAITTTRLARAEAALPATYTHWTQVTGFQINGVPAQNATIVAGRVRITKNGGGNFVSTDVLTYGDGGASGNLKFPEDYTNSLWKNLPIVDLGVAGLDGIPISALPSTTVLANTITPTNPVFTTIASPATYFLEPVASGAMAGSQLTVLIDASSLPTPSASVNLFLPSGGKVGLNYIGTRVPRVTVKDSANTTLLSNATYAALPTGAVKIVLSVDLVARTMKMWVNDALWADVSLGTNTGSFDMASRQLCFLASNAGASPAPGTWKRLAAWTVATTDGSLPSTGLVHDVVGPASAANSNTWKVGANAT